MRAYVLRYYAFEKIEVEAPNDPKLSDGGAWRGSCEGGAQKEATDVGQSHDRTRRVQARIAATVTRGAVRCSAWLNEAAKAALKLGVVSGTG